MKEVGLDITIEGDLTDFLGVNIDQHEDDGMIHLTQSDTQGLTLRY
jgi:hypothetical protein